MCGRVIQSSDPLRLAIVDGLEVSDSRMGNVRPRYNAAPSQELLVIWENHETGERSLDLIRWGLIQEGLAGLDREPKRPRLGGCAGSPSRKAPCFLIPWSA